MNTDYRCGEWASAPVWKPAIQQAWKPALQRKGRGRLNISRLVKKRVEGVSEARHSLAPPSRCEVTDSHSSSLREGAVPKRNFGDAVERIPTGRTLRMGAFSPQRKRRARRARPTCFCPREGHPVSAVSSAICVHLCPSVVKNPGYFVVNSSGMGIAIDTPTAFVSLARRFCGNYPQTLTV